ncbi:hypothetical protein TYRP_020627 [Tyrophagus putrescentiae]|nr:hypothetical protein TYRP_020627 [Tyrophagus putrescentiae]
MGFGFCGCSSSCCDDPEESCPRLRNLPATSTAPTEEFGRRGGGRKGGRKGGGKKDMNLRRSRGGGGGCGGGRIFHNNFLVKSLRGDDGDDDHQDNGDQPSAVIGLLAGRYKLLAEGSSFSSSPVNADEEASSALNLHLPPLQLLKFEATTVADELAEFRLLNHKDRVIIRALEGGGKVLFGSKITEEKEEGVKHYFSLEHQAVLVLRGPVTIHYHHHHTTVQKALSTEEEDDENEKKTEEVGEEKDEDDDKEDEDEKEANKEVENLEQSGGDAVKASSSGSSPSSSSQTNSLQSTKYSGHVALSLTGAATIVVHPPPKVENSSSSSTPTEIFLPAGSKFSLDRAVPLRFQQKSIVQRQREQHQASHGLMALETFDHLIGGLF